MSGLEFLANMNISPITVEKLRGLGWNIIRVSEVMGRGTRDAVILDYAKEHTKVLITQDLDFSALLAAKRYDKPSVVSLRFDNAEPNFIADRIVEVVTEFEEELKEGVVISVDETSARYRNLPIMF